MMHVLNCDAYKYIMEGFLGHCALDAWVVELNVLY